MPLIVSQLKDKNIIVLGAGLSGLSCARFLQNNDLSFTVIDSRENPLNVVDSSGKNLQRASASAFTQQYPLGKLFSSSWHSELIKHADVIITSPGIDISASEIADYIGQDCQLLGDVELYCQVNNQDQQTPILAVTGSNGKSTVVSLLAYLGQALGFNTQLGGNIGLPVLDQMLSDIESNAIDFLVIELSSFQLETLNSMQAIAATILNISDDHLDRHKTIENYQKLKQKIYPQSNIAIFNRDDALTQVTPMIEHQTVISFGSDEPITGQFGLKWIDNKQQLMFGEQVLMAVEDLPIAGVHNALNCLAALALGMCAGWPLIAMINELPHFVGLAHRCQKVASDDQIHWINDSKATNVGATLAAIDGLSAGMSHSNSSVNKLILIVGGDGKGADFSPLKPAFEQHVNIIITLGKDGDKFKQLSDEITNAVIDTYSVTTMEQAVNKAKKLADEGDTVLLSPACASIDMFKNYIERGNTFVRAIQSVEVLTTKETLS